jgi:hypothetical protein
MSSVREPRIAVELAFDQLLDAVGDITESQVRGGSRLRAGRVAMSSRTSPEAAVLHAPASDVVVRRFA